MTPIIPERELTTEEQAVIRRMLVETKRGEVKQETWDAVHKLDL